MKNSVIYGVSFTCLKFIWTYSLTLVPIGYSVQKSEANGMNAPEENGHAHKSALTRSFFFFFAHTIASHSTIPLYIFYCPFDVKFWPSSFHENCPSWRYVTGTKSSAYEKHEKTFSGAFRAHFSGPNSFRDFWETCVEVFPKRSLDWRCHNVLLLAGFVLIFSGKTEGKTEIPVVKCHFTVVSLSQFQNESWYKHKFWYGNKLNSIARHRATKLISIWLYNRTHCETKVWKTTRKWPIQPKKFSRTSRWRSHVQIWRGDIFLPHRASNLHFIFSFLVVEKVWLLRRKKTSKQRRRGSRHIIIKRIVEYVSLEDLIWTNYSKLVHPASEAEGKGKGS